MHIVMWKNNNNNKKKTIDSETSSQPDGFKTFKLIQAN